VPSNDTIVSRLLSIVLFAACHIWHTQIMMTARSNKGHDMTTIIPASYSDLWDLIERHIVAEPSDETPAGPARDGMIRQAADYLVDLAERAGVTWGDDWADLAEAHNGDILTILYRAQVAYNRTLTQWTLTIHGAEYGTGRPTTATRTCESRDAAEALASEVMDGAECTEIERIILTAGPSPCLGCPGCHAGDVCDNRRVAGAWAQVQCMCPICTPRPELPTYDPTDGSWGEVDSGWRWIEGV